MLSLRTAAALSILWLPPLLAASDITYTASGTFASLALRGADMAKLAGNPFSIQIVVNESVKPTKHTQTSALYTNLTASWAVVSGLLPSSPVAFTSTGLSLYLKVGASGQPDEIRISFPTNVLSQVLTVFAAATLPAGTLTTPAIAPFTAPVALTAANDTVAYSNTYAATSLAVSTGMFNATVGARPPVKTLYEFTGPGGQNPAGAVALGAGGVLYGSTPYGGAYNSGTIYQLAQSSSGVWTETVLYNFSGNDGAYPASGVMLGSNGALYGVTGSGGASGSGVVFELTPPTVAGGQWSETVLYSFTGPDGSDPTGALAQDSNGALYGTTYAGGASNMGTVFRLSPAAVAGAPWSETVLYSFTGVNGDGALPSAGVVIGSEATGQPVLYGTTQWGGGASNAGTAFSLTPASTAGESWTEKVIYTFTSDWPQALMLGPNGRLYGTTYGGYVDQGTVFELAPGPLGAPWTETVLHAFNTAGDGANPAAGILIAKSGALFGTTYRGGFGWGTIFKLTPPAVPGGAWIESLPVSFDFFDGAYPAGPLIQDVSGVLYGTTQSGCMPPCTGGTVFELKP